METDPMHVAFVEEEDWVLIDDEVLFITDIEDSDDFIVLFTVDKYGDNDGYTFAPFDTIHVITRFEEDIEVEDIEV